MRKSEMVIVVCVHLFACLTSCGPQSLDEVPSPTVQTHEVTDDLGRRITLPVKIKRVVSTAPSVTEMIFAVGAGDRLVGVTTFCDYPEDAKSIAKIGDTMNPNLETILALYPDVVFVSKASQLEGFVKVLDSKGIPVYVLAPVGTMGLAHDLTELGSIFDTQDTAIKLVTDLSKREDAVRTTLETYSTPKDPVRVFLQISREPLFTIGKESILNEIIEAAAARSVTANVPTAYPKLSKETALALQPEAIILSDSPDNQEPNEVFRNSPAVKNGRVYKINADIISRPGPRLVDALEQIAKMLHPEKFPE